MSRAEDIRVVIVGDFPPPTGGVATHVEELFRAVRSRGGTCEVLDIGKGQLPADGVVAAGNVPRFAALLASYARRGFRIHLHTSGANPKSWALAAACGVAGNGSALITFHSGLGPAWLRAKSLRASVASHVLRRFGRIIAVSQEIADCLVECGAPQDRVAVVPAFSREFLRPGAPPAGFAALRAEAAPLFCAMLAPGAVYGHDALLSAFATVRARLPQARLAVYGLGTEEVRGPGVTAFGQVLRPAALAMMAACDVFVRPTLADGDSVSVREALALGRPVVATRCGHRPVEVRLVEPGDPASLAEGMVAAAAPQVRTLADAGPDPLHRVLELYGFDFAASATTAAPEETPACAASAAS